MIDRLLELVTLPVAHAQIFWPKPEDTGLQSGTGNISDVKIFIGVLLTRFVEFSGFAATAVIVYAGYLYMTQLGDPAAVAKAKQLAIYALVGFVVVLLASGAVSVILQLPFFSASSTAEIPALPGAVPSGAPASIPPSQP